MTFLPPYRSDSAARPGRLLYIEDNAVNTLVVEELVALRPQLRLDCAVDGRWQMAGKECCVHNLCNRI